MRIGISGATGFVGSHLVRSLAKQGHEITAFTRVEPPEELKKVAECIIWDMRKRPQGKDLKAFIHCAGMVDFWGSYRQMYELNVIGTKRALQLAKKAKSSQVVIARLESGMDQRTPSLDLLERIARALKAKLLVSFDYKHAA